jgi:hypothetical protein
MEMEAFIKILKIFIYFGKVGRPRVMAGRGYLVPSIFSLKWSILASLGLAKLVLTAFVVAATFVQHLKS